MEAKEKKKSGEVVVMIGDEGSHTPAQASSTTEKVQLSTIMASTCPSPEINKFTTHSPNRPPKIPQPQQVLTQRRSLTRSVYSKPKSRFVELPPPTTTTSTITTTTTTGTTVQDYPMSSPSHNIPIGTAPITPKTPLMASPGGEDEDDEIYKIDRVPELIEKSRKRVKIMVMLEWSALFIIISWLVATLTVNYLKHCLLWGLEIWKWSVLVLVIVCGRFVTEKSIHVMVFLIERNFLLRTKVLYFVYGLKNSVQVCVWLSLVLVAWALLINRGVKRSKHATKILNYVSRAIFSLLIGAIVWLVKTLLMKILAASFHVNTFFDRIQESIFHQYVLQTLSGPPLMELAERIGRSKSTAQLSFRSTKKGKGDKDQEVIDVSKLHKMKQKKVSAWTMKGLVNVITTTGLSTISNTIDEIDSEREQREKEITSEWEARAAAYNIFRNVAKPGHKYIDEEDLLRFLSKEEVGNVLPLFEGALETGKIKKSALRNWVVKVYLDRKSLAHSLNDTKTAVKQLNSIVTAVVIVIIIVLWLLIMGFATVQVFLFISSQMVVAAFIFGNTAKTIFESIIFVFVMHPFDVGDRCVIGGVQMIVEEMNILTTVFLRYDQEKIYYPNSVLATKPISNFYRSPDMGDAVEFSVDVSTSIESIGALKSRIKMYLENKPQHWRPNHSVVVKEIENLNKMKMALFVTHTMNHQNYGEKSNRRTELVLEMKKIFEELSIKYHLLPQEVQLSYIGSAAAATNVGRCDHCMTQGVPTN